MNHINEEQLVLYYYGETAETAGVEQHLGACESCRAAYHTLQRVLNSVDSFPVPERAAEYEARVWSALERHLPRRRRGFVSQFLGWRPLAVAASMAVLVIAAFLAGRGSLNPPAAPAANL